MNNCRLPIADCRMGERAAPPRISFGNRHSAIGNSSGFTLVEAVFATLLVGLLLVAALSTAGASARVQAHGSDRGTGELLAQGLMNEILAQAYQDAGPSPVFGPTASEVTTPPSRSKFSDVDDYNGWSESPPQNKDGSVITMTNTDGTTSPAFPGWGRSVAVAWVTSSDLTTPSSTETGVKRIVVTVTHNNAVVATCTAIKANNPASQ